MHLGAYSLFLLIAAANAGLLAVLLVRPMGRHVGSGVLAALVAAIALRTVPYILGYAGAYDAYPALTFAPFDLTLAWGPLLWCYVATLAHGAPPPRWRWHLAPAALQLAYQLVCFALPLPLKWEWYTGAHLHWVEPVGVVAALLSVGLYAAAAWRRYDRWQRWLDDNVSNRDESRLGWLRTILIGITAIALLGAGMTIVHFSVHPLDYIGRLPIIAALAVVTYVMGLLGVRFGREAIPMTAPKRAEVPAPAHPVHAAAPSAPTVSRDKDYRLQAEQWRAEIVAQRWHHDPLLTLTSLAAALDTSPRTLSRTLNEGLGVSFNRFINGLRVEDAVVRLRQPGAPDVLRVALDVGFASKASFNRAFKAHTGTTPSAVRSAELSEPTAQDPPRPPVAPSESTR